MANPIGNAKTYAKITGIALAAVALLGIVLTLVGGGNYGLINCGDNPTTTTNEKGNLTCTNEAAASESFLAFDWTHNILHVVLAAVALYVGFGNVSAAMTTMYAKVFGIVYAGLGVAGFFWTGFSTSVLHLEMGENLVHLVIGLWGVYAGFFGTTTGTGTTTPTTARPTTTPGGTPPRRN